MLVPLDFIIKEEPLNKGNVLVQVYVLITQKNVHIVAQLGNTHANNLFYPFNIVLLV